MSFGRFGRTRRVVVTAFTDDRRILQLWDLDLSVGQRIPIPAGTNSVEIHDPTTVKRTRVVLSQRSRRLRGAG